MVKNNDVVYMITLKVILDHFEGQEFSPKEMDSLHKWDKRLFKGCSSMAEKFSHVIPSVPKIAL